MRVSPAAASTLGQSKQFVRVGSDVYPLCVDGDCFSPSDDRATCVCQSFRRFQRPGRFDMSGDERSFVFGVLDSWFPISATVLPLERIVPLMDRSSASGFPTCLTHPTKGSAIDDPGFASACDHAWEDLDHGDFLWTVMGKKDNLPVSKVLKKGCRTIQFPDVTLLSVAMRLFSDQNEKLHRLPICCGVDTAHDGVIQLASSLLSYYWILSLDESGWDGHFKSDLQNVVRDWRLRHLACSDADRARVVSWYRIQSHFDALLPDGSVVRSVEGMPSGSYNTSIDNSLGTIAARLTCIKRLYPSLTVSSFLQHFSLLSLGDDVLLASDREYPLTGVPDMESRLFALEPQDIVITDAAAGLLGHSFLGHHFQASEVAFAMDKMRYTLAVHPPDQCVQLVRCARLWAYAAWCYRNHDPRWTLVYEAYVLCCLRSGHSYMTADRLIEVCSHQA